MTYQGFGRFGARLTLMIGLGVALVLALVGVLTVADLRAQEESQVLIACSSQSGLRLVSDASECRGNETAVQWNVSGPPGPAGPQGPAGSSQVSLHLSDLPPVSETRAAYIKFDGIDGESQSQGYEGWSEIVSFNHGFQVPISGTGTARGAGRPNVSDIVIVKEVDKASPPIARSGLLGQHISEVEIHLTVRDNEGQRQVYLKYELTNVVISGYQLGGSGQSDVLPTEEMSLNFEEIKVTYTELDETGKPGASVEYQYNLSTGSSN